MKHSYKSRVNFSFLTTVVVIAIIITLPSVRNLYSATKDTYRIIENKFRIFNQMIQYVNEYYYDEVDLEKIWDGAYIQRKSYILRKPVLSSCYQC